MVSVKIEAKLRMTREMAAQCVSDSKLREKYGSDIPWSAYVKELRKCMVKNLKGRKVQVKTGLYQNVASGPITKVEKPKVK